jgi:hypothetical protein
MVGRFTSDHLELPAAEHPFRRADLIFYGLDHSGPSYEAQVFMAARRVGGYPDEQRSFFLPRDSVHPLLASLLGSAQHSLVLNMYGYDDEELDDLIRGKLDSKLVE